jgi:hypothetical protein
MALLTPDRVLTLWEQGSRRHPIDRALLLFALAAPDTPAARLADLPLGRRNAALVALYEASFGSRLAAWLDCPACAERMEFATDTAALPRPADDAARPFVEVQGMRFHRPTSRHLARLVEAAGAEAAARRLLLECADAPGALPRDDEALDALLDAVETALEAIDPCADMTVAVRCPACGHEGAAALDIAAILWEEIESRARRLLDDVHALARSYGWSEPQILALSEERRAAYLARALA